MEIFTLILVDVEIENENWEVWENRETPCAIYVHCTAMQCDDFDMPYFLSLMIQLLQQS